jgi:putative tricarboxylic transport membrane protein
MEHLLGSGVLETAGHALVTLLSPERIMFLWFGVLVGLMIGLLPGIGGLTGFALLVPFTYTMEPISALAMLIGMHSVTGTSDTIPAVLFGVPGTAASQATVVDGLQMTKKGEAGRALSAAYTSSLIGGLIGALIMAVSLPVVRPLVLSIATPELLAMTIFGIAMVSTLSGRSPLRGIVGACFGILVGMIGTNVQTGQLRWTFDLLYLRDGIPMLPVLLGIFALPELCDLAVSRKGLTDRLEFSARTGMWQGVKDAARSWFLILRCSSIGAVLGAIPGISSAVTDWIVYGHALRTERGAEETFGTGDVRGVIAPECAVNAGEGGRLVPLLAFGVPGGAAGAILLGAMMVQGFIPGPDMLTRNLQFTYTMVWSIALANVFGAGLCFLLSGQFARISTLRYTLVLPIIMAVTFVGAFQGSKDWGDLYTLLIFGVIGWAMKRLKWPRPPLILGLVLGVLIERYLAISTLRYGADWLTRPGVVLMFAAAAWVLVTPLYRIVRRRGLGGLVPRGRFSVRPEDLAYVFFLGVAAWMLIEAQGWFFNARIGPTWVAGTLLVAGTLSLIRVLFSDRDSPQVPEDKSHGMHMDLASDQGLPTATVLIRAGQFLGWYLFFLAGTALIGMIPTIPLMIFGYMQLHGRERMGLTLAIAAGATLFIWLVFDRLIQVPWPHSYLRIWAPSLRGIIPSI